MVGTSNEVVKFAMETKKGRKEIIKKLIKKFTKSHFFTISEENFYHYFTRGTILKLRELVVYYEVHYNFSNHNETIECLISEIYRKERENIEAARERKANSASENFTTTP